MLAAKVGFFRQSFTPRSIANLAAWWDCSDATRYTLISNLVSSFTDSTGTYTITQGTAANRPSISTLNGRGAFLFNGLSTSLFSSTPITSPWGTYFWVARSPSTDVSGRTILQQGASTPSIARAAFGHSTAGQGLWCTGNNVGGTITGLSGATAAANVPYICASVIPNSALLTLRVNGVSGSVSATPPIGNSFGIMFGARNVNGLPSYLWNGLVGEVIWYSRTLDATEIARVETYLKDRWSISF